MFPVENQEKKKTQQTIKNSEKLIKMNGAPLQINEKIIKGSKHFMAQAQTEIKLLGLLLKHDPKGHSQTVRMKRHFVFRNHQCIVFEMLFCNLYELLRNTSFNGISLRLTKRIARQILRSL